MCVCLLKLITNQNSLTSVSFPELLRYFNIILFLLTILYFVQMLNCSAFSRGLHFCSNPYKGKKNFILRFVTLLLLVLCKTTRHVRYHIVCCVCYIPIYDTVYPKVKIFLFTLWVLIKTSHLIKKWNMYLVFLQRRDNKGRRPVVVSRRAPAEWSHVTGGAE